MENIIKKLIFGADGVDGGPIMHGINNVRPAALVPVKRSKGIAGKTRRLIKSASFNWIP